MKINEINTSTLLDFEGDEWKALPAYTKAVILSANVASWACEMTDDILVGAIFDALHNMDFDLEEMSKDKTVLDFLALVTNSDPSDFNLDQWVNDQIQFMLEIWELEDPDQD